MGSNRRLQCSTFLIQSTVGLSGNMKLIIAAFQLSTQDLEEREKTGSLEGGIMSGHNNISTSKL